MTSRRAGQIATYAMVVALAAVFALPFVWMLTTAVKPHDEIFTYPPRWIPSVWKVGNFAAAWTKAPFARFFFNSVVVTASVVGIQLMTASLAAYAFARLRFPGKSVLFLAYLSIIMVPSQVTLIPNFITLKNLGLLNTYGALILPFAATGFGTFLIRQYFLSIPTELFDAATMDGANHLYTLWHVCLPLARPALATFALLTTMWHWNDFFWPLIVTNSVNMRTMPLGLVVFTHSEQGTSWDLLMAAGIFTALPVVVLFLAAQRYFVQGIARVGIKG
ncbi:MAG TPA: carbohydrate ABC transporter permease [bacterium]|nr:carbohydrate ABC transporter permease [bacterium]